MQKEFEKQEKLKALDEEHKKQMVKDLEEQEEKHKQHEPVTAVSLVSHEGVSPKVIHRFM